MARSLVAIVVVPAIALVAWLSTASRADRADLVVASDSLRVLDPQLVSWLDEIQVAATLFEGLTRLNPVTHRPEPALATHWDVSPDGLTWTFALRPSNWSNGDSLTASDFAWSWLQVLDPRLASPYATLFFVIDGAEAYHTSRLDDAPNNDLPDSAVGVHVIEPLKLEIRLRNPCPYLLDLTSFPTWAPVHRATVEAAQTATGRRDSRWLRPERHVCNGAFRLSDWAFKQRLGLERNPAYWDSKNISLGSIEICMVSDANAALVAYETGRVDVVRDVSAEAARGLLDAERADFQVGDRFATYFYRVNCTRAPLNNPRVRRALSLVIDREALCARITALGEQPALTLVPPAATELMARETHTGVIRYPAIEGLGEGLSYAERCALARSALAEAVQHPADLRPIEIAFAPTPPIHRRIAEAIQTMWQRELGIRVELRATERTVLNEQVRNLQYDVARGDWYGDYFDPATFLDIFHSGSGHNRTGWRDARYDHLLREATSAEDLRARYAAFAEAERLLCREELPILPLFFRRGGMLVRPGIDGLHGNLRDTAPLHRARVMPDRSAIRGSAELQPDQGD